LGIRPCILSWIADPALRTAPYAGTSCSRPGGPADRFAATLIYFRQRSAPMRRRPTQIDVGLHGTAIRAGTAAALFASCFLTAIEFCNAVAA
jgi:hypothetical protein